MTDNNSVEKKDNDNINAIIEANEAIAVLNAIINESSPELPAIINIRDGQVEVSGATEIPAYERFWSCASDIDGFECLKIIDEPAVNESTAEDVASASNHIRTNHTKRRYRIHIGTRPGFYTSDLFTYEQSQWRHEKLVSLLVQFQYNLKKALLDNYQFDIALKNAFSTTETWGLEPYASIIFESCEIIRVEGIAAIIGQIFRQDGIGIFDENDDYQEQPIGANIDNFDIHKIFVIFPSNETNELPFPGDDAREIMTTIHRRYSDLSGQFGQSNQTIELHDYCNQRSYITFVDIQKILDSIRGNLTQSYKVVERKSKSKLLLNEKYENAIKQADFQLLANTIEIVRLHDTFFNNN